MSQFVPNNAHLLIKRHSLLNLSKRGKVKTPQKWGFSYGIFSQKHLFLYKNIKKVLTKKSIKNQLQTKKMDMARFGISKIGLFGSFVKGEAKPDSDVDILIDFVEGQETFDNFMNACLFLEDLFKDRKVEVVTVNGLSPFIGPYILKEVEYV